MACDLHMHSTASDGSDPPEVLAALAHEHRLTAIALTDHDTTAGLGACETACRKLGVTFIPGIEISCEASAARIHHEGKRGTLHILGYFIRHDDEKLAEIHQHLMLARAQRNPQMVEKLRELGVRIDYDEVVHLAAGQVIGRPHIARVLLSKGYAKSMQDAFKRYLGEGAAAYVRKDNLHPHKAIDAIHHAGGIAVMAHPCQLRCVDDAELEYAVKQLVEMGLDGLETRHSDHLPEQIHHYEKLADQFNLVATGGSDYHGPSKPISFASLRVDAAVIGHMRARRDTLTTHDKAASHHD